MLFPFSVDDIFNQAPAMVCIFNESFGELKFSKLGLFEILSIALKAETVAKRTAKFYIG